MIWFLVFGILWFVGAVVMGRLNRNHDVNPISDWFWPAFLFAWLVEKALTFPRWIGEKL